MWSGIPKLLKRNCIMDNSLSGSQNQFEEWSKIDCDAVGLDELESKLEADLQEQMSDLQDLEEDLKKIGSPDSLGETVKNVVWEQFINQVGVVAGEDFIKENRGNTLDLSNDAHIQTAENFEQGMIATHNYHSADQLNDNYQRFKETPHGKFRNEYVDPGMNATLERAGTLHGKGVDTVRDIYTGRQISTQTKFEDGANNPLAAQREHVIPSAKVYQDPSLQMSKTNEELAATINNPENLQGYTTARRNNRKSDSSADELCDVDRNKHWEKANQRAEDYLEKERKAGEERLIAEGRQTQRTEAFKVGGKALRAAVLVLLADLLMDVIRKLVAWFRSGKRELGTFIDSIKEALKSFFSNIKQKLVNAADAFITTLLTAVFGPIVGVIKKVWILLKQGWRSVKQAVDFLRDPANKNMPLSIKLMQVGKILIAGLAAGGAIVLGEVIEKALMGVPVFAFPIPLLGSLASIIGLFLGALVSGVIGALALNQMDRWISKKLKSQNFEQRFDKKNEILQTQGQLIEVAKAQVSSTKAYVANSIAKRHVEAAEHCRDVRSRVEGNSAEVESLHDSNKKGLDDISNQLNQL